MLPLEIASNMVYACDEVIIMQTVKIFTSGKSQIVKLPKEYLFPGTEVGVKRMGEMIVLYPTDRETELFYSSLGQFTDDFFTSIELARTEKLPESPRVSLN